MHIGDPYRIRTDVNGVRGRCLNHLTNGPYHFEALVFALHIFTVRGSEASAAGGRYSELSEWQRSIKSRISISPKILSGTATGIYIAANKKPPSEEGSFIVSN